MIEFSRALAVVLAAVGLVRAHTVITYPGWRGNNLITNGSLPQFTPDDLGINMNAQGERTFPYGMQFMFPCGGMPTSRNRSFWPYEGGAVSVQPGWGPDHQKAFFYINMGINGPGQSAPPNMSHSLVPPFQVSMPNATNNVGQFCLPQVPMPVNATLQPGDNVTVQVVELTEQGQALYNCVDLTLTEPHDPRVKKVTPQNCYNSSDFGFELVFTTAALSSAAPANVAPSTPLLATAIFATLLVSAWSKFS